MGTMMTGCETVPPLLSEVTEILGMPRASRGLGAFLPRTPQDLLTFR